MTHRKFAILAMMILQALAAMVHPIAHELMCPHGGEVAQSATADPSDQHCRCHHHRDRKRSPDSRSSGQENHESILRGKDCSATHCDGDCVFAIFENSSGSLHQDTVQFLTEDQSNINLIVLNLGEYNAIIPASRGPPQI